MMAARDGEIGEIYDPARGLRPWSSWLYRSEAPFSWGSGIIADAVAYVRGG